MLSFEKVTEAFVMFEAEMHIYLFIHSFINICLYSVYWERSRPSDHFGAAILSGDFHFSQATVSGYLCFIYNYMVRKINWNTNTLIENVAQQ